MTTAISYTPQVPGLVKAPGGRAGANITVHDRARGAFQDLLSQTIEQRLEQIEQKKSEGDARSRPGRAGRFAATELHGQVDGAVHAGRRTIAAELHDQVDGVVHAGRRATATELHGQVDGAVHAGRRTIAAELHGQVDGAVHAGRRATATELHGQIDGAARGAKGHARKGFAVGIRGELVGCEENLMGKNRLAHPRGPGRTKALEEITPMPGKGLEPVFGRTPFEGKAMPLAPVQTEDATVGEATAGETLDVTSLWKEFMKRWIEGSKNEEDDKTEDEAADEQSDKAAGLKGLKHWRGARRFVPDQSDQVAGLERSAASIVEGMVGGVSRDVAPLWKEFMRQWMEGLVDKGATNGTPDADPLKAFRAGLSS